jgi:hypothetical protein
MPLQEVNDVHFGSMEKLDSDSVVWPLLSVPPGRIAHQDQLHSACVWRGGGFRCRTYPQSELLQKAEKLDDVYYKWLAGLQACF